MAFNRERDQKATEDTMAQLLRERVLANRMREAIGFCKQELGITACLDLDLRYEERVNFEKCLTENYLMKRGMDYFGKRDLIYVDLLGPGEVKSLLSPNLQTE